MFLMVDVLPQTRNEEGTVSKKQSLTPQCGRYLLDTCYMLRAGRCTRGRISNQFHDGPSLKNEIHLSQTRMGQLGLVGQQNFCISLLDLSRRGAKILL